MPLSAEEVKALQALEACDGNKAEAARLMGMPRTNFRRLLDAANLEIIRRGGSKDKLIQHPEEVDDDIPIEDYLDHLESRYEKRAKAEKARHWMPIKIKSLLPIGIAWMGDPHVDDNGCNISLLRRDCHLISSTEGMYGSNVGDVSNNWLQRYSHLWANQDTSQKTAQRLIRWFLNETGIEWLVWIMGNHDAWNGHDALIREIGGRPVWMHDWSARVSLEFAHGKKQGKTCRIFCSHDFKGHSMWNSLHGLHKTALMKDEAHIYVAGHTHQWGIHQDEIPERQFVATKIRARGYKHLDEYATRLGHFPQQEGSTIVTVIDPLAETMSGFVRAYADVEEAAFFLTAIRDRRKHEGVK